MNQNTSLVLKQTNGYLGGLLEKEKEALPAGFNPLRFKQNALTVLQDTPGLDKLKGNEYTLARTIMKGAYLGLDFFNKECYCIVYGGKAEFQTDYKGEKKLVKKYAVNPVLDIYAKLVREGDEFTEFIDCGKQTLNFKPKSFNNGAIIGAFAVVLYKDGSMMYETMSKEEIEEVRNNYSKAKNSTAWQKSVGEMYKKTVLRRLCKHIELDFDCIEQYKAFQDGAGVEFDKLAATKEVVEEKSVFEEEAPVQEVEFEEVVENEFEGSPYDDDDK